MSDLELNHRRFDVTAFGEGQLRLTLPLGTSFGNFRELRACAAGTEANITGLLARLGRRTAFVSVLPKTPLGRRVCNEVAASGTDVTGIRWVPEGRVALYFLESAEPPLAGEVLYDRTDTPFANSTVSDVDWDYLLDSHTLVLSGVTAALTAGTREILLTAVERARGAGVRVVYDVNHRHRLWSSASAAGFLREIASAVSLLFCPARDAASLLGVTGAGHDAARRVREMLSVPEVVISDGSSGAFYSADGASLCQRAEPVRILDRPGAGDALVAGMLHGWLDGRPDRGLRLGVRAAMLALTHYDDQLVCTLRDLEVADSAGELGR